LTGYYGSRWGIESGLRDLNDPLISPEQMLR
jgi:hypothetical protein